MKILARLVELEYSRFSSSVPGFSRKGIQATLGYMVFLIAGAMYLFRNHDTTEVVFALGAVLSWGLIMTIALFHMISLWGQPHREWWLSLPYPRFLLVSAKALGLMRVGVTIVILISLACMIYIQIAVAAGMMSPLTAGKGLSLMAASLLLAGSLIPVAVVMGLIISTMYSGWARWLLIPYLIIFQSPYVLFGILMSMEVPYYRYLSPSYILFYTLGIVVIGWPLSYAMMRFIAGIGLKNMADVRLRMKSTASHRNAGHMKKTAMQLTSKRGGLKALYAMERSRYRYYGSIKAVRIIKYSLLAILAVGAYFSSGYPKDSLEMLQVIFMLPVLAAGIYSMNRSSIDQKYLQWWLGYPVSRVQLMLTQLAGLWVTVLRIIAAISLSVWVGTGVGLITGRMERQDVYGFLEWFSYALVLYIAALTLSMGMLQCSYIFMKSKALALFLFPLYLLVSFQSIMINEYLYPEKLESYAQAPDWGTIGILIAVGVPLAAICMKIGASYIHRSLGVETKSILNSK